MPVIHNPPGTPLPDDHPLKGGCIILGWNRPPSSGKPSTPTAEPSSNKPDLSPFEMEARESYESAMWDQYEQATGNKRPADDPQSESTTPESPDAGSTEK